MPSSIDEGLSDDEDFLIFPLTDVDGAEDSNNNSGNGFYGNHDPVAKPDRARRSSIRGVDGDFNGFNGDGFRREGIRGEGYRGEGYRGEGFHRGVDMVARRGERRASESGGDEFSRPRQQTRWGSAKPMPLRVNVNLHHLQHQSLDGGEVAYSTSPKVNWIQAVRKVKHIKDAWEKYRINDLPSETAVRHRYHALKKQWITDKVEVKMEKESFDQGAMRNCYRVKKLPGLTHLRDWKHAHNYVAKRYMADNVSRDVYFNDVRLQLDAKLWGEEYSRHNPPKKVDIVQMAVLEFEDRPEGSRYFHLENYIEGHYTKYNSNSGFVDQNVRSTPQAFSHFTFERSGHQLMVVDIQGVGDLYTDPQLHTADGREYGDGNLGTRGMALFFHSHVCNSICESLGLSKFDLAASETPPPAVATEEKSLRLKSLCAAATRVRSDEVEPCIAASPVERSNLRLFLERERVRRLSTCSSAFLSEASEELSDGELEQQQQQQQLDDLSGGVSPRGVDDVCGSPMLMSPRPRYRFWSESDDSGLSSTRSEEEERVKFQLASNHGARPACLANEMKLCGLQRVRRASDSVLGQIHHNLAKYHEMGRFSERGADADMAAALYHEQCAADLGVKEAMVTLASIFFGLTHEILINVALERSEENIRKGTEYMVMAAEAGDRGAMLYLAHAFESGVGLAGDGGASYRDAVEWYEAAANMTREDDCGEFDGTADSPLYELRAKMAALYAEGGHGLERDLELAGQLYTEAAESATTAMKGRLASKYYALAEEVAALGEGEG